MSEPVGESKAAKPRRSVTPSLRRADPPDFAQMVSEDFEEFCCAMLDKEPGVTRADLFHTRFDAQYGIDVFGETPDGLIVVSCKRYQSVGKGKIEAWGEDFLRNWDDQWKDKQVAKFVLAVTADVSHRNRLTDIAAAKERFAEFGVEFEVWAPRQLLEKLRPFAGMTSQYLGGREWVDRICDDTDVDRAQTAETVRNDLRERLTSFTKALTGEAEKSLERAVQSLERGDVSEVERILAEVRTSPGWADMPRDVRARTIRLQGSAALTRGDLKGAKAFGAEAEAVVPAAEHRLAALIAMHESGALAALEVLGHPTTPKGRCLRASLLLVTDRLSEGEVELDALGADDPEAVRLRAFLHLQRGDRTTGLVTAERAEVLDPGNPAISRTMATALYASALSPLAPPQATLNPNPLNMLLVGQDDLSQGRLEEAMNRFRRLAQGDPLRASRRFDQVWVLACLGNMPARRDEAAVQAAEMLASDPRDTQAIGWVLMRDLAVELDASRAALTEALVQGDLQPDEAQTLDWLTPESDQAVLLDRVEHALAAKSHDRSIRKELETVRDRLRAEPSGIDLIPAVLQTAHETGDWSEAEAQFEAAMALDPPAFTLLTQAAVLSGAERWTVLARHRDTLRRFATAGASRLAAIAAYNDGDPVGALEIIGADLHLFPGKRLPFDLRRVEAEALAQIGDPLQAVRRATALAAESRLAEDGLREARLRLNLGDLEGAIPQVKAALAGKAMAPQDALVWSQTLQAEDPDLARDLWRHAVARDIDDQTALQAYGLSFNLELEGEKPDLFAALNRLADEGQGVWRISIDDIVSQAAQHHEQARTLDDQWKRSVAPAQFLARAAGASLAEVYDLNPSKPRPIFLRAGSRGEAAHDPLKPNDRRYHLDVSALLIADQLDLLPILESIGPRLHIAAATPHALLEIEQATRHHQPSRGTVSRRLLAEVGLRLGTEPPVGATIVVHDVEGTSAAFDLSQVLAGLEAAGAASAETLGEWRLALQVPPGAPASWPLAGSALVFTEDTLNQILDIDAFDAVAATWAVFIDPASLARARGARDEIQRRTTLARSITRLRRRIASKAADHYTFVGGGRRDIDPNTDAFSTSAVGRALAEIMSAAGEAPANRLWVEDRYLSSYDHAGQAPIVGVYDILDELRRSGRLDAEAYFDRLLRLRRGGALFLPLQTEEIDHHLVAATVVDGTVIETPGLAALRRNTAQAQIFADHMRLVPTGELGDRPLEVPFLLGLRRSTEAAIVARWNAPTSKETARAQSDWIWRSLRAESLPRPGAPEDDNGSSAETIVALNFAGLVAAVFHLRSANGEPSWQRREHYLDWLSDTVLKDRLARDAGVAARTVEWARDFFRLDDPENKDMSAEDRESLRGFTRAVLTQLPEYLRDAMAADARFMNDLGFGETTAMTVEDRIFSASGFWGAVAAAMNTGRGEATFSDGDGRVLFERATDEDWRIDLSGDLTISLRDANFGLLSEDPEIRQSALTALFEDCDIPLEDRSEIEAAILSQDEPDRRIQQARQVRDRSVRLYLERLAAALQARDDVGVEEFSPPAARDWLTYVRWRDPETGMAEAVEALRRDLTPAIAVGRIAGLPFTPPDVLWADVDLAALRSLTPVTRLQRLRALRLGLVGTEPLDLDAETLAATEAVTRFGGLFVALLHWGAEAFSGQEGWTDLSARQKHVVCWCFADRVTDLLGSLGLDPDQSAGFFRTQRPPRAGADLLTLEHGFNDSSLHPAAVNSTALLMAGLEYALGDAAHTLQLSEEGAETLRRGLGLSVDGAGPAVRVFPARPEVGATWMDRPAAETVLAGTDLEAVLGQAIAALETDAGDSKAWEFVYAVGVPVLPQDLSVRLGVVIGELDPAALVTGDKPIETLRYAAESVSRFTEAGQAFLDRLFLFAPVWLGASSSSTFDTRLEGLIEAAAAAARAFDGTGPRRFSDFTIGLVGACPGAAPLLRDVLDALVERTPTRLAPLFWKALQAARAA